MSGDHTYGNRSTLSYSPNSRMPQSVWLNLGARHDLSDNDDNSRKSSFSVTGQRPPGSDFVSGCIDYKVLMFHDGYTFLALFVLTLTTV